MTAKALMLLGAHSNAGKSLMATAFCRILARQGYRVAPFKAQNMSNNAGVTAQGGEMGRAQLVQAEAAGIAPHTDMNPVLLKPEADRRSQIVLNGQVYGHIDARNWFDIKRDLWQEIQAAYDRLAARFDVIVMEGAGSPAEINLKAGDVVNLRMARHASAPSLLIGDIDRGGVFAALAGTMLLLDPAERDQIKGFIINKFRGDPDMLGDATEILRRKAFGVPTLGVVPFIPDLTIADEDAVALDEPMQASGQNHVDIAVIHLPHIANFDEFDALAAEPGVHLRYVRHAADLGAPAAVILPGTKATMADLAWMRDRGLDVAVERARAAGAQVVGVCGGYQMLGRVLTDPTGVEGPACSEAPGLGLLPIATRFLPRKETHQARLRLADGRELAGYEIHSGDTRLLEGAAPLGTIVERNGRRASVSDGARSADGSVWGGYLHGLFENDSFRRDWLADLGWPGSALSLAALREAEYDRLAQVVESHLDWPRVLQIMGLAS